MTLASDNAARWGKAKLTRAGEFAAVASRLLAAKARYKAVEARTGVPWFVIAVIHQRESSGDFYGVLHNGQKIIGTGRKTTLVPKGRGPFSSWEEAAIDALTKCHPYAARNKDWSIGGALALLERYNGLGYANRKLPSPYLWAGTNQYVKGKYVADGKFDPNVIDSQLGCAGLIMEMQRQDPTIRFGAAQARMTTSQKTTAAVVVAAPATAGVAAKAGVSWSTIAIALACVIGLYLVARPTLKAVPQLKAFYASADTFWQKLSALAWRSATVAWSYAMAAGGLVLQSLDGVAAAVGDPDLKAHISEWLGGDPKTLGFVMLGIAVVTFVARMHSITRER